MTNALTCNLCGTSRTSNTGQGSTGRSLPGIFSLPGMKGLVCSAALLALIGCSNGKKIEPDKLSSIESTKQIDVLWSANLGDGSKRSVVQFAPYVSDSSVFGVNAEGEVHAFDRVSGAKIWEIDLNAELTAGISGDDRYLYAGSSNGDVYSINQADGTLAWSTKVSSEVVSAPSAGADYVVVRSIDGRVYALEKASGKRRWLYTYSVPALSLHGNGRALVVPDGVLVGLDNGRLVALRALDGRVFWESRLAGSSGRSEVDKLSDLDADPVVFGESIYAVNYQGAAARIDPSRGDTQWTTSLSSSSGLSVNGRMVVVTDEADTVWALDINDGSVLWKQENLSYRRLTAPAITDDGSVVVGDFQGYVHVLSGEDGSMAGRLKAGSGQITGRPVLRDGTIYTLGRSGRLSAIGL